MPNAIRYGVRGVSIDYLLGASVAPTLKNLANNGRKIGTVVIDPTAEGSRFHLMQFCLKWCAATAPSSSSPIIELYWVATYNGTNYEPGSDTVDPLKSSLIDTFPISGVTTPQIITRYRIAVPYVPGKILLYNKTGAASTNTDNENVLSYCFYDQSEIQ